MTRGMPYVAETRYMTMARNLGKGENYSFIISKFAKSDLDKMIKKGGLTDEVKKKYTLQLLTGLAALHDKKIAHRDIKPANINIIEDSKTHEDSVNYADLDFATTKDKPVPKGTPIYTAPEITNDKNKTIEDLLRGDVYALGSTLHELFHGKHLWYDDANYANSEKFYNRLNAMSIDEVLATFPEPVENTIDHLIWEMMHPDPSKRPMAEEAMNKLATLS
jgi:serine/threonine protein kinase